jgi:hypothetical protein
MVPETRRDTQSHDPGRQVHNVGAVKLCPLLLVVAAVAGACGGTPSAPAPSQSPSIVPAATASPSAPASPAPSPLPSEGAYGVLATYVSAGTYTISLIGADGKVASSAQASHPVSISCSSTTGADLPSPVSTSDSRVYFLDAQGVVRFLTPSGQTGKATTLPVGSKRQSTFTVSPDDKRIAVVVSDFTAAGAATSLYVEDLNGGANHKVVFTDTGVFGLWPIGWHGADLVVAKVTACTTGGGPLCCGPREFHVVDPATAVRSRTLGGPDCLPGGPPSRAGVLCETSVQANVLDWAGTTTRSFSIQNGGALRAYLSPNGNQAALVPDQDSTVEGSNTTFSGFQACGWIDSSRVLGRDEQGNPLVGDINTGALVSIAAQGFCAGRIPGGL